MEYASPGLVKNAQMQGWLPRCDADVLLMYVEEQSRQPTQQMGVFHQSLLHE
ncbi:MAG: hypothetical protein HYU98_01785 [Deltaproteobacteria bacterium]|nr:hypothetical protein [Deltaproteobacteria bacterium]